MGKRFLLIIAVYFFSSNASFAFEDDYVWQDRLQQKLASALDGNSKAQYQVGEMHEKGRGTPVDHKQAFFWYKKSASQGDLRAQFKLGYLYLNGLGVKADAKKAFKLLNSPANGGNVRAQYFLGEMYAAGNAVTRNSEQAMTWFSRASLGGYVPAEEKLKFIKLKLKKDSNSSRFSSINKNAKKNPVLKKLLNAVWKKRSKPAQVLPSKLTDCSKTSSTVIECFTTKVLKRNIGVAHLTYKTKAILYDIRKSGAFKIAYRNNITKIKKVNQEVEGLAEDEDDDKGQQNLQIKLGWQDTEHQMECKFKGGSKINCIKNKVRKITYTR